MNQPTTEDARWMTLALAEAERGRGHVEPNPMVGAVLVDRFGKLAGLGHHTRYGGPHAEVAAIAATAGNLAGMTMHVSLEPCRHHGKTPPCTKAILEAGIGRVVVATRDPFELVNGGGIEDLRQAGVDVQVWPFESPIARQATRLNRPFFKRVMSGRPYVIAKWAMSLDGRIALANGDSRWISGERSRAIVHEMRGRVDGVMVGIGTALADDPSLTARPPGPRTAARIVIDPQAELPVASQLAKTARETTVLVICGETAPRQHRNALQQAGCDVIALPPAAEGSLSPVTILDELGRRGMTNVLIEGGSKLLGRFLDANCIDEAAVFVTPVLFGGPARFSPVVGGQVLTMDKVPRLTDVKTTLIGTDTLIEGLLPSAWFDQLGQILSA